MQRIALRHYRLFSRAPYLEFVGDTIAIRLPSVFGGRARWTIPLAELAVVRPHHLVQVTQDRGTGRVFVEPVLTPYLSTTSPNVSPNLELLFRSPQRIPPIRLAAIINTKLSYRLSRSAKGMFLDGVALRAVNPKAAAETLASAGAELVPSPGWWLTEHRETTTDPQAVEKVRTNGARTRIAAKAAGLAFPLLLVARWGADHSAGWWPYPLVGALAGAFGVNAWAKKSNRENDVATAKPAPASTPGTPPEPGPQ